MIDRRSCRVAFLLLPALASCTAERQPDRERQASPAGLVIAFEDVPAPEVFQFEGEVAIASEERGTGLWAAVPGLDRPERALLQSPTTGRTAVAPLFRAPAGTRPFISPATARSLGIGPGGTTPLRIRALRSEVRLQVPPTGF